MPQRRPTRDSGRADCRRGPPARPADFTDFCARWLAAPEGQWQWDAASKRRKCEDARSTAAVVWWSDPIGRKHCRLVADRVPSGRGLFPFRQGRDGNVYERPLLWQIYSDDLYLRDVGGTWQLWAVCRCGARGPAEELGWMGPWCAACHDRAEEGGLDARPDVSPPVVLTGHTTCALDLAFSPDGRSLLALGERPPAIWAWDTLTGQARRRDFDGERAQALAVSSRGMAAVCVDGVVRVWSITDGFDVPTPTGQLWRSLDLESPVDQGVSLAFSPDGSLLAVACSEQGGRLLLFDLTTGEEHWVIRLGNTSMIWGWRTLAFSPDGKVLALGWNGFRARRWDVEGGRELPVLGEGGAVPLALAYSPGGRYLAVVADEDPGLGMLLFDLVSEARKEYIPGPLGVAFSPDGSLLITVEGWDYIRLRRGTDGRLLGTFRWHPGDIVSLAFTPDGQWLATSGSDGRIKLWPVDALLAAVSPSTSPPPS